MDQVSLIQKTQRVQKLLREDSDQRGAQAPELVLLDQLIQIDAE